MNIPMPWREALAYPLLGLLLSCFMEPVPAVEEPHGLPKQIRIGYQKAGTLILLKSKGDLERRLQPLGVAVRWAEFPFGPPMLEALNADSLDFATTGETPPVFAQAAQGSRLVYVGQEPASPESEAIVVPEHSPIHDLAGLKGQRVAVAKGSNAHYLLIRALRQAGLEPKDIQLIYLAPADARAAFERGALDAWAIWDFYRGSAEIQLKARVLADGRGLVNNFENYTSRREFAERHPELIRIVLEEIAHADAWAAAHPEEAAQVLSQHTGLETDILVPAIQRRHYGATPVTPELLDNQQRIADTLFSIGLIPKAIQVRDAVPVFRDRLLSHQP